MLMMRKTARGRLGLWLAASGSIEKEVRGWGVNLATTFDQGFGYKKKGWPPTWMISSSISRQSTSRSLEQQQ